MKMDEKKIEELGGHAAVIMLPAVMRYVTGCILRERERLARAIPQYADKILDSSMDDFVFKWNGPETSLDTSPKSYKKEETN